ncbi:MAG: FeoB-associated Cys-rich membrane protein [Bacillota bacterium]|nr:FeoB-associated Cys-rich membrane protein [Bacillota bacterium]
MINWIIGIIIFLAAGYMMFKHIQRSKQGKCPHCASKCSCGEDHC